MGSNLSPRILVVEDEGMVSRFYGRVLEQNGFVVCQVTSGEAAIEAALKQSFEVAVIDLRLQGKLDGLTTYRVLKALHPTMKGIIITGYGNRQSLVEALRLGVEGWLEKPVTVTELLKAVRKALHAPSEKAPPQDWRMLTSSDKNALLRLFLQMLMATTLSDIGILWLIDHNENSVTPQLALGNFHLPLSTVPYTPTGEWLISLKTITDEATQSHCLVVPVKWQGEFLGALVISRRSLTGIPYNQSDLFYLERFAEWLAPLLLAWLYPIEVITNLVSILDSLAGMLHGQVDPTERNHPHHLRLIVHHVGKVLGLPHDRLMLLELAATLHDLGKVLLPNEILVKATGLTDEERRLIQQHPIFSEQILRQIGFPDSLVLWVRWHHERYDGEGYPDRRRYEEIPLEAQIIAIAETLDTLLSPRPYKPPLSFDEALEIIRQERGKQFAPAVVDALEQAASKLRELSQSPAHVNQTLTDDANAPTHGVSVGHP